MRRRRGLGVSRDPCGGNRAQEDPSPQLSLSDSVTQLGAGAGSWSGVRVSVLSLHLLESGRNSAVLLGQLRGLLQPPS